jgi:hypothetical protein
LNILKAIKAWFQYHAELNRLRTNQQHAFNYWMVTWDDLTIAKAGGNQGDIDTVHKVYYHRMQMYRDCKAKVKIHQKAGWRGMLTDAES